MSEFQDKLRDAANRATTFTVGSDDAAVSILVRNYGFLVEGRHEVDDGYMLRAQRQILWAMFEREPNPLLRAVENVIEDLHKAAAKT